MNAPAPDFEEAARRWADARLAARLLACDPAGLGGVQVRARPGPVREAWLTGFQAACAGPVRTAPAGAEDDRLFGGLDLAATLAAGAPVRSAGLLEGADGGAVLFPGAERMGAERAARVAALMDSGEPAFAAVLLDEGADEGEGAPPALTERSAFRIDLDGLPWRVAEWDDAAEDAPARASHAALDVTVEDPVIEALTQAALAFGVHSPRAAILAVRAARAHAVLEGRDAVGEDDVAAALRLVIIPRATRMPAMEEDVDEGGEPETPDETPSPPRDEAEAAAEPPENEKNDPPDADEIAAMADRVLAAALARLPDGLLDETLARAKTRSGEAGRKGANAAPATRGRRKGVKRGDPRRGGRLDLLATVKAAAPFRKARGAPAGRVVVRPDDFRITRFHRPQGASVIFAVDASGSAALNRLGEAKGAVEILLGECYARRDEAALVAFRGDGAEVLLPPTRSLTRAKRLLAHLPGGGGTPLAAGLEAACALALRARARRRRVTLVVLSDGGANIARSGARGRAAGAEDALCAAKDVHAEGLDVVLIDVSPRGDARARELARTMAAVYVAMPAADARKLAGAVQAAGASGSAAAASPMKEKAA